MPPRAPPSPTRPTSSFSFMSGNFDFPHASTSPPPYHEQFRDHLVRRQEEAQAAREHAAASDQDEEAVMMPHRRPRGEPPRRRPLRRSLPGERESRDTANALRRITLPPPSTTVRPRATPSERYLRRSYARVRDQRQANMRGDSPDALDSLSDGSNHDAPANARTRPRSPSGDVDTQRRQTKRRKLDHDADNAQTTGGFRYGYNGQVVPGRLRMEVVSCDGGEYEKYSSNGLYSIHNVLKNDKSVYCSESSRCNLLLKHTGETPFALEKIVIRTPDRGFTAPVQEGLIFVSMSSDELINGTTGYKIEYESPSPRPSVAPSSSADQHISLQEAVEDPYIWEHSRLGRQEAMEEQIERLRLRNRTLRRRVASSVWHSGSGRHREDSASADNHDDPFGEACDYPVDQSFATAAGISAPTPPPFTITTESDEESDDQEEMPSAAIMADRMRRESRWRSDSGDDDDDLLYRFPPPRRAFALGDSMENSAARRRREFRDHEPIRATRLSAPSRIEPKEDISDGSGWIAAHAKFFIAKSKNKITIKFHPAVSGKFVLLKLWSPTHDGNIDIENVQFHGYSGPRYFPAQQVR
ncbi:hypothetical protein BCR34DRAFT_597966 [Clohesyomyces aquaticus]|uniref:Uncharacterized protein n=1 Tax=Clohesyomyces aquaticus TaxID=1231657 RepID=A0A1Y2A0W7_9PLEO|nr:hypothetical protein BCR34DRAFT_597966 [Clohesyomyces aquaticus]